MKKYKYSAVNLQKKRFTGTFLAENEEELRSSLASQNLYLLKCSLMSERSPSQFFSVSGKLTLSELTSFCRQFAIMINSGISILDCLYILRGQSYSSYFKKVLYMVYEDVKVGLLLSQAMKKHTKAFPEFFQSMVYVGEISGQLDIVLTNIADYYENDAAIKKKVKSAMAYPIVLMVLIIGIIALMMLVIVPTFKETLSDMEVEIPTITQMVYDFSDFLQESGLKVLAVVLAIGLAIVLYGRTQKGRLVLDKLSLQLPLIAPVQRNMFATKFARGFGLLLKSGMDIVDALEVVCNVMGNRYLQQQFRLAIEDVRQGMLLTLALETYKLFPDLLVQMVSVGEKSGTMDEVLMRSIGYFDERVLTSMSAVTSAIQPALMLMMGVVIAVMFIAIYSPMLGIMTGIGA